MSRYFVLALAMSAMCSVWGSHAHAQDCTAADYAAAVDRSGAELSKESRAVQPKIQQRMRKYQEVKGLSDTDYESSALEAIRDSKLEELDATSSELLLKIDSMGRLPDGKAPSCAEVADIDSMGKQLLGIVRNKSDYILARLDAKIAEAAPNEKSAVKKPEPAAAKPDTAQKAPPAPKAVAKTEPKPEAKPQAAQQPAQQAAPPTPPVAPPATAKVTPKAAPSATRETWTAETKPDDLFKPDQSARVGEPAAAPVEGANTVDVAQGYSIDEVREATRGFFGTISTSLASVIEHAFKTAGRPTAYVLGTEGGGAFLAGLRFGDGTLFMRNHPQTRKVWWHGPSIGGDFGASGTRTMFLIYKLENEDALFRSFTGVDGSAFFVGGVGMTVLKGGDVIMAPIRTGIGLRVGASIGYVRFTPNPTWNPF